MSGFDSAFDPAFDSAAVAQTGVVSVPLEISTVRYGRCVAPLSVVVAPPASDLWISEPNWSGRVLINGLDWSDRLTGRVEIEAREDAARVASFDLMLPVGGDPEAFDSAEVSITFCHGPAVSILLFSGRVEYPEYSDQQGVATLHCRDGWQERPASCKTAAEVEALFCGMAIAAPEVSAFDAADPRSYFQSLLETLPGATYIDASGNWRVVRWEIGAPRRTFSDNDFYDGSLEISFAQRANVPRYVKISLAHRYTRLHDAECCLGWQAPTIYEIAMDGLPWCTRETVVNALNGLSEWIPRAAPAIVSPAPGNYEYFADGKTGYYCISADTAPYLCKSFEHRLFKRWYQEMTATFETTLDFGWGCETPATVSASVSSTFDSSVWEAPASKPVAGMLKVDNIVGQAGGSEGVGSDYLYPDPQPPRNGAMDHLADIDAAARKRIARSLVAKAVRQVAGGRRGRAVKISCLLDAALEIGDCVDINGARVVARGQISAASWTLDIERGDADSSFTVAIPKGASSAVASADGVDAVLSLDCESPSHVLQAPALATYVGQRSDTPPSLDATAQGFFCNATFGTRYDPAKPSYGAQMRITMPEIPAALRDPLTPAGKIDAAWTISGGDLAFSV